MVLVSKILKNLYWCTFRIDYSLKVFSEFRIFFITWGARDEVSYDLSYDPPDYCQID